MGSEQGQNAAEQSSRWRMPLIILAVLFLIYAFSFGPVVLLSNHVSLLKFVQEDVNSEPGRVFSEEL